MNIAQKSIMPLLLTLVLFGCSYDTALDLFEPKEESAFAKEFLEYIRSGDIETARQHIHEKSITQDINNSLRKLTSYFPTGELVEIKTIGVNVFNTADSWQANLTYQYEFEHEWVVAVVSLYRKNDKLSVLGVTVDRIPESLETMYAFTLGGKSPGHYFILVLALLIPAFVISSLIRCVRTPIKKRKWLWIVFILLGFVDVSLNWTTGEYMTNLFSLHLLGAAAFSSGPYAPWIITVSIPLGAIIFRFRRKDTSNIDIIETAHNQTEQ